MEEEIRSLHGRYLWGGSGDNKKVALSWEALHKTKMEGGMGFKILGAFNKVLLGKWIWRFIEEEDQLSTKVIHFRHDNPR